MQYDYYYHAGQMHQTTLRQEAERERLLQALPQGSSRFYHHRATRPGRSMMQSGQQLLQFGKHALKATHMLPEGKM